MKELQYAMALRPGQPVQTSSETKFLIGEYDLLDYVSDFVDYSPTTGLVDFSHKSIRQFLTDPGTRASYFKDWEPRTYLTGACLQYLSDDKVWIEQPLDPEEAKDHLKQRDERFPFADYADRLWAHHAQGDPESSLRDTILSFLKKGPHITNVEWFQYVDVHKGYGHTYVVPRYMGLYYPNSTPAFYELCMAAFHNLREILRTLKEKGYNVNNFDEMGCTVLHVAAYRGHAEVINTLVDLWGKEEMAALVNIPDSRRATALHYACDESFERVAEMLLDMSANSDGSTLDNGENA